jgi:hypothetical protein
MIKKKKKFINSIYIEFKGYLIIIFILYVNKLFILLLNEIKFIHLSRIIKKLVGANIKIEVN